MEKFRLRTVLGNHPRVQAVTRGELRSELLDLDFTEFAPKGTPDFARSADWRTEADRILARIKS